MSMELQQVLHNAAGKILRLLVRVMLRNGIACRTFEEMVRKAYVDEAFAQSQKRPGRTTVSSVSAETGLSRKEVKRLFELPLAEVTENTRKYNRAVRVISGWLNDAKYTSREGVAVPLDMDGGEKSFTSLVKQYSGDIPPRAMFDLLQKSRCVEKIDGKVCLISHAYVPGNDPADVIDILGTDTQELMNSIIHNMSCEKTQRYFQRKVSTRLLASAHVEAFQKYAGRRSQALLEDLDNWLCLHESQNNEASRYVSVGIYFYQGDEGEETQK